MNEKNKAFLERVSLFISQRFTFVCPEVAHFIASISALESDFGQSAISQDNTNFFGMKFPKVRLSTAIGENRGHSVYPSFGASVCDFFYWLQYFGFSQKHFRDLKVFKSKFFRSPYNTHLSYQFRVESIYNQYYGKNE